MAVIEFIVYDWLPLLPVAWLFLHYVQLTSCLPVDSLWLLSAVRLTAVAGCSETDRSIPEYNAYNHHYFSWLTGSDSEATSIDLLLTYY